MILFFDKTEVGGVYSPCFGLLDEHGRAAGVYVRTGTAEESNDRAGLAQRIAASYNALRGFSLEQIARIGVNVPAETGIYAEQMERATSLYTARLIAEQADAEIAVLRAELAALKGA